MTPPLSDETVERLVKRFEHICRSQAEALHEDSFERYAHLCDELRVVVDELQSRPGDQRSALTALYDHPNRHVRLKSAIHTLETDRASARDVLEEIQASQSYPPAADARMMLQTLDYGTQRVI